MIDYCVIDIETIPWRNCPEACRPVFDPGSVKLGNLKDPAKVAEKINQAREDFQASMDKTMSVDPDLCEICCIVGYDSSGEWLVPNSDDMNLVAFEYSMLHETWWWLSEKLARGIPLVTFNGLGFDLPIMLRRSMIIDVDVHPDLVAKLTMPRQANQTHFDIMQLLSRRNPFSGKVEVRRLAHYLSLFNIGAKTEGMDGSQVFPAWKEGRFHEIVEYCKQDVSMTAALWERISPWMGHAMRKKPFETEANAKE
jgi:hypothetical protein